MASLEIAEKDCNISKHQKRINGHCKSISDDNIPGMRIADGDENMQTAVLLDTSQCDEKLVESHKREAVLANQMATEFDGQRLGMNHQSLSRHHTKPDVCTLDGLINNANLHIVEHETDCCRQQLDIEHVEKLDDKEVSEGARKNSEIALEKRTVLTIPRNIKSTAHGSGKCQRNFGSSNKYSCKDLELYEGVGITHERKECLNCKCFFISRDDLNPSHIVKTLQESPLMDDNRQKEVISISNNVVTVAYVHGVLVISVNAPVVKVTFSVVSCLHGIAEKHIACHCKKIFTNIEIVLHKENLQFNTVKTCQDNGLMTYCDAFVPTDAELVAELDSLNTALCRSKDAMTSQFIKDFSKHEQGAFAAESNHLNSLKKQAGLRSKYQTISQRISQIGKELSTRTSTQALEVTENKSVESDKANEFPQDEVDAAVSEDANISQIPGTSSAVQQPIETATNTSEVHYPIEKLLKYFTSSLQQQDWDGLRYEMQSHIPRYVLCSLQNGNEFFQELVHRNLISDQDMKLLRDAFFQIKRIDCVHYIDLAKESQSLLQLQKNIQVQTVSGSTGEIVSGTTGEIYNQSVTAVQQNRSITDEAGYIPGATGFQITSEVVNDSRENFAGETMQSQEEKLRRENNAVRRSNKGAQQGHQTGAQGDYENPSSISQKSFSGPVQEAAAMCPNPLQPRSNEIRSQSRKEGPQESFDADKYSDYHLATRRTRASQLDEQVQHHGECSNDGITPNEPNHAGSRQDEILITEIYITGSHKTGSCECENIDTGSCVTYNTSNASALSQDAVKLKTRNCAAGSIKTGICNGESNHGASSNSGNFQLKSRRKKKRNGKLSKPLKFSCEHYDRYCDVQFGCCKEFWACHRCHNSNSKCEEKKWRSRDIKKIRCKRCSTVQEVSSSL